MLCADLRTMVERHGQSRLTPSQQQLLLTDHCQPDKHGDDNADDRTRTEWALILWTRAARGVARHARNYLQVGI